MSEAGTIDAIDDHDIKIGRLYKRNSEYINFGERLYILAERFSYTTSEFALRKIMKVIQIDDRIPNKITEIYASEIHKHYVLVEDV